MGHYAGGGVAQYPSPDANADDTTRDFGGCGTAVHRAVRRNMSNALTPRALHGTREEAHTTAARTSSSGMSSRGHPHLPTFARGSWGGGGQGVSNPIAKNCRKLRENRCAVPQPPKASTSNTSAQGTHRAPTRTRGGYAQSNCGRIMENCEIAKRCATLRAWTRGRGGRA